MKTILYEQAAPFEGKELSVAKCELFVFHMNRAFGEFPVTLGKDQLERLEGMKATWSETSANPYDELIRGIKRYGLIKVWEKFEVDNEVQT